MDRRFNAFVAGSFLSRLGDHLGEFGLTLMLLDRYPGQLTPALGFGISRGVVALFLGSWLGGLFDRFPTRRVLLGAVGLSGFSLLCFALLYSVAGVAPAWFWLCGAGLAVGGFTYETGLTYSLLPQLGEGPELGRLTALFHSLGQIGEVLGPVTAGFLYAWWGGAGVLGTDVLTFAAEGAGILLVSIPLAPVHPDEPPVARPSGFLWHTLRACHRSLPFMVLSVGFAWCNGMSPHATSLTFFLKDHLEVTAMGLGGIRSLAAVASISATMLSPAICRWMNGYRRPLVLGIGLEFLALAAAALWRETLPLLLASMVASRFGLHVYLFAATRLRQELIPSRVRGAINGRINAFYRGMGLLTQLLQLPLDHSARSFALLAWGTAAAMGAATVAAVGAYRRLEDALPNIVRPSSGKPAA